MKNVGIEKEELFLLVSEGLTNEEIAKKLHVSRSTIIGRLNQYGIKRPRLTKDFVISNLPNFNYVKDFAKQYGFKAKTVSTFISKNKIKFEKNFQIKEKFLMNKSWLENEYLNNNTTLSELSNKLRCSRETIKKYLSLHDIKQKPNNKEKVWFIDFSKVNFSNKTTKEVANELGCSEEYVRQYQINNNIPRNSYTQISLVEKEFRKKLKYNDLIFNSKEIIKPFELDIYSPSKKIAFEINGIYWHSTKFLDKDYHFRKFKLCLNKGVRLYQIWETEINTFSINKKRGNIIILDNMKDSILDYPNYKLIKEIKPTPIKFGKHIAYNAGWSVIKWQL